MERQVREREGFKEGMQGNLQSRKKGVKGKIKMEGRKQCFGSVCFWASWL